MDHKWASIACRSGVKTGVVSAIAWAMIDHASQQTDRGSVAGFDAETYAVYSGFSEAEIDAVIKAMIDKGFIKNDRLANWETRQPKREDDSRERVRNFRMKHDVTLSNAPDTDTDTDKEAGGENDSASLIKTIFDSNGQQPFQNSEEKIYRAVTLHPTVPGGADGGNLLEIIAKIRRQHNLDDNQTADFLRPYWKAFKERYPSSTNSFWLTEWAVTGVIPNEAKRPKPSRKPVEMD